MPSRVFVFLLVAPTALAAFLFSSFSSRNSPTLDTRGAEMAYRVPPTPVSAVARASDPCTSGNLNDHHKRWQQLGFACSLILAIFWVVLHFAALRYTPIGQKWYGHFLPLVIGLPLSILLPLAALWHAPTLNIKCAPRRATPLDEILFLGAFLGSYLLIGFLASLADRFTQPSPPHPERC